MDENKVHVIAAEGGVIEAKHVGEPSRTCRTGVATPYHGNYIAIKHSNGTITMYMHMKGGTLTSKLEGDTVVTGEYLGVVGSSGNSSGPHLHFEVRSSTDRILDPFQNGVCKDDAFGQITQSLWANEEPYHNKKILSVFTLSAPWTNASCDTNGITSGISETVPYRNHFSESNVIYFSAAVRDIHQGNTVRLRILNPAGTEIYDNTYTSPASDTFRKIRLVPAQFTLAPAAVGTYRLLSTYNSKTESHLFTVGCPGALTLNGARVSNSGAISGSTINSTETLSSTVQNVKYEAETSIQFNPGFQAVAGSEFIGRITPCTVGGQ
jgi:murein DD-endopeptidase MepM/ murein hydrolase activator NlpD